MKVGSLATRGEGSSKKEAQQQAARHALRELLAGRIERSPLALVLVDQPARRRIRRPRATPTSTRIRAEIARLRTRLDDVRTQTRSAEHDLEEADLELGIRTNELQLAIDMQSQLEEQRRETESQIAALAPRIARAEGLPPQASGRALSPRRTQLRAHAAVDRRSPRSGAGDVDAQLPRLARRARRHALPGRARAARRADERARRREQKVAAGARASSSSASAPSPRACGQRSGRCARCATEESDIEQKLAELEEKARRLEHLLDVLSRQKERPRRRPTSAACRARWRGRFRGRSSSTSDKQRNAKFSTVTFNNGLKIAAAPGAEVRAVFQGTVLFSSGSRDTAI